MAFWFVTLTYWGTAAPAEYLTETWDTSSGLPHNTVRAIAQTPDGYLWIGTENGLARFDGVRFENFVRENTPVLQNPSVDFLQVDSTGKLWVGSGGHVLTWDGRRLVDQNWPWPAGEWVGRLLISHTNEIFFTTGAGRLMHGTLTAQGNYQWTSSPAAGRSMFAADAHGEIWRLSEGSALWRLTGSQAEQVQIPEGAGQINRMVADASGRIWLAGEHQLLTLDGGQFRVVAPPSGETNFSATELFPEQDGSLWVVANGNLRKFQNGGWCTNTCPWPAHLPQLWNFNDDREGNLWFGHFGVGLIRLAEDGRVEILNAHDGLPSDRVRCLVQDREGNLWVGMDRGGLVRLRKNNFKCLARRTACPIRLCSASVRTRTEPSGPALSAAVWTGGRTENLPASISARMIRPVMYLRLFRTGAGGFGSAHAKTECLSVRMKKLRGHFPPTPSRSRPAPFFRIAPARSGSVRARVFFAGARAGWSRSAPIRKWRPPTCARLQKMLTARSGSARMATGCTVFKVESIPRFMWLTGCRTNLSARYMLIRMGRYGSACTGAACFAGKKAASCARRRRRICRTMSSVISKGTIGADLWISTHHGLFRVAKADLHAFAEGRAKSVPCIAYGKSDGLPALEFSGGLQPAGWRGRDGRLWFGTDNGLVALQPAAITVNRLPPPVVVESLLVDGELFAASTDKGAEVLDLQQVLRVPAGRTQFEFRFTGLSFTAPDKVRFQYRLEGLQKDWLDADMNRSVAYNYLPPGKYVFRVRAANNDGIWNENGAAVGFELLPHFWQRWWFRLVMVAIVIALAWFAYYVRMARLRELERLRLRIARDLHDDVGANLASLALIAEAMERQPAFGDPADLRRIALYTIDSLRDIVWFIDPARDNLGDLVSRMRDIAPGLLTGIKFDFQTNVPNPAINLPPVFRRNVFPIFKEALHNAARHAHADRVEIVLDCRNGALRLKIMDNGSGFIEKNITPGNGLRNLRRRADEMRGAVVIHSVPGQGTTVEFYAPFPRTRGLGFGL